MHNHRLDNAKLLPDGTLPATAIHVGSGRCKLLDCLHAIIWRQAHASIHVISQFLSCRLQDSGAFCAEVRHGTHSHDVQSATLKHHLSSSKMLWPQKRQHKFMHGCTHQACTGEYRERVPYEGCRVFYFGYVQGVLLRPRPYGYASGCCCCCLLLSTVLVQGSFTTIVSTSGFVPSYLISNFFRSSLSRADCLIFSSIDASTRHTTCSDRHVSRVQLHRR
jgi:hypothetical protein